MKKDKLSLIIPVLAIAGVLGIGGCATVKDTISLQDVAVTGPIQQVPLHINSEEAKAGEFHFSPYITKNNPTVIEGNVDRSSYAPGSKNLHWTISEMTVGADFDAKLSRTLALTFGINTSSSNGNNYAGGNLGLGLLFYGDAIAGRFDGGIRLHSMSYDASTVVVRQTTSWFTSETSTTTMFFHDYDNATVWDYYFSLMFNTKVQSSPVQWFCQLAVSRESLTDFNPSREVINGLFYTYIKVDERASSSATFFMVTPGVYVNLSNSTRLLGGVRIAEESEITEGSASPIFMPVLQLDFKF